MSAWQRPKYARRTLETGIGCTGENLEKPVSDDRGLAGCDYLLNDVQELAGPALHSEVLIAVVEHDCP
jgi:hypothetical protein